MQTLTNIHYSFNDSESRRRKVLLKVLWQSGWYTLVAIYTLATRSKELNEHEKKILNHDFMYVKSVREKMIR